MTIPTNPTFNELPGNTIIPSLQTEDIFIQYLNRLYEDIAFAVNNKDNIAFEMPISTLATDIVTLPRFGSFMIAVSGTLNTQPTGIWALCKSDSRVAGVITPLTFQAGTVDWAANVITVTSTLTNFQIAHNRANFTGNFSIRIISSL